MASSTGNLLQPLDDPVMASIRCALAMLGVAAQNPARWKLRVGIHVGPVVAGVVGQSKSASISGDNTVNVAARLSGLGSEAAIHLSGEAFARVEGRCRCVPLGPIEFKGGRQIVVYRHQHDEGEGTEKSSCRTRLTIAVAAFRQQEDNDGRGISGGDAMRSRDFILATLLFWSRSAPRPPTSSCGGRRGTTPRRTRRSGRSSPLSSRRLANRSSSYSIPGRSSRHDRGRARGGPAARLRVRPWLRRLVAKWALDDRLVDLTDTIGAFSNLFDPDAARLARCCSTRGRGRRALYGLPMGHITHHLHVWKSLLEQAGFTLEDIPQEWDAFWSFWCDQVQPAVRRATGRDDIWGVGLHVGRLTTPGSILPVRRLPTRRTT